MLLVLGVPERTVMGVTGWSGTFDGGPLSARDGPDSA